MITKQQFRTLKNSYFRNNVFLEMKFETYLEKYPETDYADFQGYIENYINEFKKNYFKIKGLV